MFKSFLSATAVFCVTAVVCLSVFASEPVELVILHTNDHHGCIVPVDEQGGLAIQATVIKQEREKYKNVLLLDAGDVNTGQPASNMFKAQPDFEIYRLLQYDAVALGNHEFDHPKSVLLQQKQILGNIPFICTNVHEKSTGKLLVQSYMIKEIAGIRVGVFGLLVNQSSLMDSGSYITIDDEIQTAQKMVKLLRDEKKVNVVIALTHMGDIKLFEGHTTSVDLGNAVDGIDLIIDGHAHSYLKEPKVTKNAPVVTANAYSRYVGKAILKVQDGKVRLESWTPLPVDVKTKPDPEAEQILAPYIKKATDDLKIVIATASQPFKLGEKESRVGECAICNLVCDSTFDYLVQCNNPVDFVLSNGGVFRAGLQQGNVTKEDIKTVLPYGNTIVIVEMKGSDVQALFEFVASFYQSNGGFGQVSKQVRYTITYNNGRDGKISNLTIDGKPIDPNKVYKIAINSYMYNGGDGYDIFKQCCINAVDTHIIIGDAVIEMLQKHSGTIVPILDGRITVRGGMEQFKHITERK